MKDPTRLADPRSQAPEPLRRLLAAAKSDPTNQARIQKLGARLGPLIGGGGTGGAAPGGTGGVGTGVSVASAAGGAVKLGMAVVLAAAVATGALVEHMGANTAGDAAKGTPSTALAATALSPTPAIPSALAPVPVVAARASAMVPSVATAKPITPPSAMAAPKAIAPVRESTPELRSPDNRALPLVAEPQPEPTSAPEPVPTEETRDEAEVALLQAAQSALRDDPNGALAITDRHAARFGAGSLAQEREVIAIEALVKLGRLDEAQERATKFSRDFPNSAHRRRVDAIVHGAAHKP